MVEIQSSLRGVVIRVPVAPGDPVEPSTTVVVIESMKMEYAVEAEAAGAVRAVAVAAGDQVDVGDVLVSVDDRPAGPDADRAETGRAGADQAETDRAGADRAEAPVPTAPPVPAPAVTGEDGAEPLGPGRPAGADDPGPGAPGGERVRADVAEVQARHALTHDAARPDAVERRHRRGLRTARANVADLCDPGTFVEYGPLLVAAQRSRRSLDELQRKTPADGLVAGVGRIDGRPTAVLAYDFTVLAGTQGYYNHHKKDRLFELVERQGLPVVCFAEGGGGRPGDSDVPVVSGLDTMAFHLFARLSGCVPLVGIVAGRCFAGNAVLAGACDVIIGVAGANLGMGGPAMIEGGGLGVYSPEEIGPLDEQVANGVVDIAVTDEAEAVAVARRYLGYFHGPVAEWSCCDQLALRDIVPENRRQVYDVHRVVDVLADEGSVLELRGGFAPGLVTALARIEGRPVGILANNPLHLAGAIDADCADKGARFLQLCDAHDLPVLYLCDTPGFMVGPEAERTALVRHVARLFVTGANLSVPFATVVLRKAYGLGAQSMAGGSFKAPLFCVAWPTGELGGMGLEGAVRLGFRNELAAIEDDEERQRVFDAMVAAAYERGRALNTATLFEIDDVIDPVDTRRWVTGVLLAGAEQVSGGAGSRRPPGKKRPFVDTW